MVPKVESADAGYAGAQYNLGRMYYKGEAVEQDYVEAAKWYHFSDLSDLSADAGDADAQHNLGLMHFQDEGVEQDLADFTIPSMTQIKTDTEGLKWMQCQLAAAQEHTNALKTLDLMQQHNLFPTPPPSTAVTAILLTSAKASKYNNENGIVVEPAEGVAIKPGRAAVLLDGEAAPISFKLMNLLVHL